MLFPSFWRSLVDFSDQSGFHVSQYERRQFDASVKLKILMFQLLGNMEGLRTVGRQAGSQGRGIGYNPLPPI
tara:strand:- start:2999 stop:3214 length:216 start_codon:yes stop_codon:yes gene_type:complete